MNKKKEIKTKIATEVGEAILDDEVRFDILLTEKFDTSNLGISVISTKYNDSHFFDLQITFMEIKRPNFIYGVFAIEPKRKIVSIDLIPRERMKTNAYKFCFASGQEAYSDPRPTNHFYMLENFFHKKLVEKKIMDE